MGFGDTYLNITIAHKEHNKRENKTRTVGYTFFFFRNLSGYPVVGHGGDQILVIVDTATGNVTAFFRLLREIGDPIETKKVMSAKKALDILIPQGKSMTTNITSIRLGYYSKNMHYEQTKMYPIWIFFKESAFQNDYSDYICVNAITGETFV